MRIASPEMIDFFVVGEIELNNARAEEPIDSHSCIIVVPLEAKEKRNLSKPGLEEDCLPMNKQAETQFVFLDTVVLVSDVFSK